MTTFLLVFLLCIAVSGWVGTILLHKRQDRYALTSQDERDVVVRALDNYLATSKNDLDELRGIGFKIPEQMSLPEDLANRLRRK